ncbi:MAG TPA: hypothetical protein VM492_15620 [Sumerlaeia bacterium]|nr:hypothetical protein [Sumerlaeia bacterium]
MRPEERRTNAAPSRPRYERPRIVRVAIRTSRENLQWQYADSGLGACTNHNHDSIQGGCAYPQ